MLRLAFVMLGQTQTAVENKEMSDLTISFIGAGNMGGALISGLIASGQKPDYIWASCPSDDDLARLHARFGIHVAKDNVACAAQADAIILAVKPQIIRTIVAEIAPIAIQNKPLLISIAAGVEISTLQQNLSSDFPMVRAMPNTPALICQSATALYANAAVSAQQKQWADNIFNAVGTTVWLEQEAQLLSVAALSGSGPAYFFLLLQALEEAASTIDLPQDIAMKLIVQTALGSANMAKESKTPVATLLKQVISPAGGTEKALHTLAQHGFTQAVIQAVLDAKKRYIELMHGN